IGAEARPVCGAGPNVSPQSRVYRRTETNLGVHGGALPAGQLVAIELISRAVLTADSRAPSIQACLTDVCSPAKWTTPSRSVIVDWNWVSWPGASTAASPNAYGSSIQLWVCPRPVEKTSLRSPCTSCSPRNANAYRSSSFIESQRDASSAQV